MGRARWGVLVVAAALAGGAAPAGAQTIPSIDLGGDVVKACGAAFGAGAFAGFASKGQLAAGEPISVGLSWDRSALTAEKVDVLNCVSVDGVVAPAMSGVDEGVANRGSHRYSFTLPRDTRLGTKVCERSAVLGPEEATGRVAERLVASCYTVVAADAKTAVSGRMGPEAPLPSPQPKAAPAPAPAGAPVMSPAAPAPKPAPEAAAPAADDALVAGKTETRPAAGGTAAAADASPALPRTGVASRLLAAGAGLLFLLGGLGVAFGTGRRNGLGSRAR